MLALVSVDKRLDYWTAELLKGPDDYGLRPPSNDKLRRWLWFGIQFQAARDAGLFFAVMPE